MRTCRSTKGSFPFLGSDSFGERQLFNSVTLSHDTLKKYFPRSYTAKQMEKVIIKLLDNWLKKRQQEQQR